MRYFSVGHSPSQTLPTPAWVKIFSKESYRAVSPTVLSLSTCLVVSPIIVPIVLVESAVGGGVVLVAVLSVVVAFSLPVPQAVKAPTKVRMYNHFFIVIFRVEGGSFFS